MIQKANKVRFLTRPLPQTECFRNSFCVLHFLAFGTAVYCTGTNFAKKTCFFPPTKRLHSLQRVWFRFRTFFGETASWQIDKSLWSRKTSKPRFWTKTKLRMHFSGFSGGSRIVQIDRFPNNCKILTALAYWLLLLLPVSLRLFGKVVLISQPLFTLCLNDFEKKSQPCLLDLQHFKSFKCCHPWFHNRWSSARMCRHRPGYTHASFLPDFNVGGKTKTALKRKYMSAYENQCLYHDMLVS